MIYIVILILLIILSVHFDINGNKENRLLWYRFMLGVFVLVAGLRWRLGIDTPNYLYSFYHECPTLDLISWEDLTSIGEDPFYMLLLSFVKTIGGRFFVFQIIHATIINVLIFHFIKKNSNQLFTCLFFYAITCYASYNMEILRGSLSIVICLYANDFLLDKKWLKGYLLLLLALMFHVQTIVLFALPFLFFLRFNKWGVIACIGAFFLGMVIMSLLSNYLLLFDVNDAISDKVSAYERSDKYGGQSGNIYFFIVNIFPLLIYVLLSFFYIKKRKPNNNLMKYEPMIVLGVMFIIMRMNLEIAYRYVDYYKIYFCLFFAEFFIGMIKDSRLSIKVMALLKSCIVFLPFFMIFIGYYFFVIKDYRIRYIPYSSVFERRVNFKREQVFNELNASDPYYPYANINEY